MIKSNMYLGLLSALFFISVIPNGYAGNKLLYVEDFALECNE